MASHDAPILGPRRQRCGRGDRSQSDGREGRGDFIRSGAPENGAGTAEVGLELVDAKLRAIKSIEIGDREGGSGNTEQRTDDGRF